MKWQNFDHVSKPTHSIHYLCLCHSCTEGVYTIYVGLLCTKVGFWHRKVESQVTGLRQDRQGILRHPVRRGSRFLSPRGVYECTRKFVATAIQFHSLPQPASPLSLLLCQLFLLPLTSDPATCCSIDTVRPPHFYYDSEARIPTTLPLPPIYPKLPPRLCDLQDLSLQTCRTNTTNRLPTRRPLPTKIPADTTAASSSSSSSSSHSRATTNPSRATSKATRPSRAACTTNRDRNREATAATRPSSSNHHRATSPMGGAAAGRPARRGSVLVSWPPWLAAAVWISYSKMDVLRPGEASVCPIWVGVEMGERREGRGKASVTQERKGGAVTFEKQVKKKEVQNEGLR